MVLYVRLQIYIWTSQLLPKLIAHLVRNTLIDVFYKKNKKEKEKKKANVFWILVVSLHKIFFFNMKKKIFFVFQHSVRYRSVINKEHYGEKMTCVFLTPVYWAEPWSITSTCSVQATTRKIVINGYILLSAAEKSGSKYKALDGWASYLFLGCNLLDDD